MDVKLIIKKMIEKMSQYQNSESKRFLKILLDSDNDSHEKPLKKNESMELFKRLKKILKDFIEDFVKLFQKSFLSLKGGKMQGSIHMNSVGTVTGVPSPFTSTDVVPLGFLRSNYLPLSGGKILGNLDFGGSRIVTGLADPQLPKDAVNLQTMSKMLNNFIHSPHGLLSLEGGLMKGHIDMGGTARIHRLAEPVVDSDAASLGTIKKVINTVNADSLRVLSLHGGRMEGSLDMKGHVIEGLADPVNRNDAVNLHFLHKVIRNISVKAIGAVSIRGGKLMGSLDMNKHRLTGLSYPEEDRDAVCFSFLKNEYLSFFGGIMKGDLDMGGSFKISGILAPQNPTDAVNLDFLKKSLEKITITSLGGLSTVGGDVTGNLDFQQKYTVTGLRDPKHIKDAVNWAFLQDNYLSLKGGFLGGSLICNEGITIRNLPAPELPQDAVNLETLQKAIAVITVDAIGAFPLTGGMLRGNLSMGSFLIQDLSDAQDDRDAVNLRLLKQSIEKMESRIRDGLPLVGGAMGGMINMKNLYTVTGLRDPLAKSDAVNLSYLTRMLESISDRSLKVLSLSGGIMAGSINMNSVYTITNVPNAKEPTDVANLQTVIDKCSEISSDSLQALSIYGGVMKGSIDMGFQYIVRGLSDPVSFSDAVNLKTLEKRLSLINAQSLNALPISGGMMRGHIDMGGGYTVTGLRSPRSLQDAVDLSTLNDKIQALSFAYFPLSGGLLKGPLNMNKNKITGLANPSEDTDAINLQTLKNFLGIYTNVEQGFLSLHGGSIKGNIDMGGTGIVSGLMSPQKPQDAVNLEYLEAFPRLKFFLSRMLTFPLPTWPLAQWSGSAYMSWMPHCQEATLRSFVAPNVMQQYRNNLYLIANLGRELSISLSGYTQLFIHGIAIPDEGILNSSIFLEMKEDFQSFLIGSAPVVDAGNFILSSSCFSETAPLFRISNDVDRVYNFRLMMLQWSLSVF